MFIFCFLLGIYKGLGSSFCFGFHMSFFDSFVISGDGGCYYSQHIVVSIFNPRIVSKWK